MLRKWGFVFTFCLVLMSCLSVVPLNGCGSSSSTDTTTSSVTTSTVGGQSVPQVAGTYSGSFFGQKAGGGTITITTSSLNITQESSSIYVSLSNITINGQHPTYPGTINSSGNVTITGDLISSGTVTNRQSQDYTGQHSAATNKISGSFAGTVILREYAGLDGNYQPQYTNNTHAIENGTFTLEAASN